VFVDDDSADDTAEHLRDLGRTDRLIRCIRRFGRRGLSSGCIEGILSTSARYIAVIDAIFSTTKLCRRAYWTS
jgi:dolichol-phosphate mannosyltransferase